ncbi:MAG: heparinase II/III family protein, partial [Clostridia bacterium]|nr:heparinase II/III family protein [Clostridia bacterium]
MVRIFKDRGITAEYVIEKKDFELFSDVGSKNFVPEKMEHIVKRAEKHLEADIPLLPLSVFIEFRDNGNRSNYQDIYFKRRTMALELALAELYEKKGRFTVKLMDTVWAIMEESTWIIPAHMYTSPTHGELGVPPVYDVSRIHGIDLFSASTSGVLTFIYDNLKAELDELSPIICEKMNFMLYDRTVKPYLNCSFWWTGERGNSVNNWCPWITSNVLHTAAVIVDDLYTRKRVVTKALASLDAFSSEYKPDGGCTEGPGYWGAAGASYFDCLELLEDISGGRISVYDHPLVKAMFTYIAKFNINGRRFINFADCAPFSHHDGAMIRRMGVKCGSESLCAFGDTMATVGDIVCSYSHVYRSLRNLMTPTPAASGSKADKRVWFPDLKVMTARESEEPSRGIFVAMKGGTNGEQHNHNDVGNIVVYYNGNPVFIDTGAGTYTKDTFGPK